MKILFMCVANSARSQLAEGIAKEILGNSADVRSAGSKPSKVNPYSVRALSEQGIESRDLFSKSVEDLPAEFVSNIDYVITLCAEEVCPLIISKAKRLHWPLPDPAGIDEDDDAQLERFRATRDEIRSRILQFATEVGLRKV